jgi:hypothetical protein
MGALRVVPLGCIACMCREQIVPIDLACCLFAVMLHPTGYASHHIPPKYCLELSCANAFCIARLAVQALIVPYSGGVEACQLNSTSRCCNRGLTLLPMACCFCLGTDESSPYIQMLHGITAACTVATVWRAVCCCLANSLGSCGGGRAALQHWASLDLHCVLWRTESVYKVCVQMRRCPLSFLTCEQQAAFLLCHVCAAGSEWRGNHGWLPLYSMGMAVLAGTQQRCLRLGCTVVYVGVYMRACWAGVNCRAIVAGPGLPLQSTMCVRFEGVLCTVALILCCACDQAQGKKGRHVPAVACAV